MFTLLARLSLVAALGLPLAVIPPALAASHSNTSNACGWDTSTGWVARENVKVGNSNWANGIALEYSGDYTAKEKGVSPTQWNRNTVGPKAVEGWFDAPSATCGDQLGLHITGNGRPVTIKIYRMGYYSGAGARLITSTTIGAIKQYGSSQISKAPESTVTTNWPVAWYLKINQATIPWQYLLRLDDGDGSGQFRYMEYPILRRAEQLGLDMNYITDLELDNNIASLKNTRSILYGGHGEYWTVNMRKALQSAVDSGINFVSLGGNAGYAHPRLQANDRQLVMWRSSLADPDRNDPVLATTGWRQIPISQPEATLLGAQYVGLGVSADYTIPHPNRWPFTTMTHPGALKSIVGREVDSPLYSIGPAVEVLADSALGKAVTIMATYYTNAKNAGVVDVQARTKISALQRI